MQHQSRKCHQGIKYYTSKSKMQNQDRKCHQGRKYNIKIGSGIEMSSRRRKYNTKKRNVIKVENPLHQSRKCKFKICHQGRKCNINVYHLVQRKINLKEQQSTEVMKFNPRQLIHHLNWIEIAVLK